MIQTGALIKFFLLQFVAIFCFFLVFFFFFFLFFLRWMIIYSMKDYSYTFDTIDLFLLLKVHFNSMVYIILLHFIINKRKELFSLDRQLKCKSLLFAHIFNQNFPFFTHIVLHMHPLYLYTKSKHSIVEINSSFIWMIYKTAH